MRMVKFSYLGNAEIVVRFYSLSKTMSKLCDFEGCCRSHHAKGLCRKHYYKVANEKRIRDGYYRTDKVRARRCKYMKGYREGEESKAQHRAGQRVYMAIKRGVLGRKSCEVCGESNVQAHHNDYSKPLEVVWLCSKHHTIHHYGIV